jgi:biopolymer transport protein TolR
VVLGRDLDIARQVELDLVGVVPVEGAPVRLTVSEGRSKSELVPGSWTWSWSLLIIFMVVMPLAEKDFAVRIPANEQVQTPDEVPPDQVVVRVEGSGQLVLNGQPVPDDAYVEALAQRLAQRAPQDRVVFLTPEDEAPYRRLVLALEGARQAGASALGMVAEPVAAVTGSQANRGARATQADGLSRAALGPSPVG